MGVDGTAPVPNSFMGALSVPGAERVWGGFVGADRGLGYQGSYFSVGGLAPLTTDVFDGTWFFDGRGHVAVDRGRFFGNFGLGRRTYFDPFMSIIGLSGWYDYDGDDFEGFGHSFNQLGVTGEMFNELFDFRINGYMPVARNTFLLSPNEFYQHNVLTLNGIDSALTGFDAKFSLRPKFMGPLNGYIDIGGYGYKSSAVRGFGGVSTGFGVQPVPGWALNMEVNHDDEFGTTGFIRVAFGLGGSPGNSRTQNRLLEPTRRNDHIVRYNQQPQFATNPVTGQLWNVIHVDNSNAPVGDGTAENPFKRLVDGQNASAVNDIIYVHYGDGTAFNQANGITLKNDQQLLGSATTHYIQTTEVGLFALKPIDKLNPIITNPAGAAVTLANRNVVSGLTIQYAQTGISGTGIDTTSITQNEIFQPATNGILLTNFTGHADIASNKIKQTGIDGIRVVGADGTFEIHKNNITNSVKDGIHFIDSTGAFFLHDNVIVQTVKDSVHFENTTGLAYLVREELASNGIGANAGLHSENNVAGRFDITVQDSIIQGNGTGITVEARGAGAEVNAVIHVNKQITAQEGDGIRIASRFGSVINFSVYDNPHIKFNGLPTGGGYGLHLSAEDATLVGLTQGNTFLQNAGLLAGPVVFGIQGVLGTFVGDSFTDLTIRSNLFDGRAGASIVPPVGNGIEMDYLTTNSLVNKLTIDNNRILNSRGEGVWVTTGATSVVDVSLVNNTITGSLLSGFRADSFEASNLRVIGNGNTVSGNAAGNIQFAAGFDFTSSDTSRTIVELSDNVASTNRLGGSTIDGFRGVATGASLMAVKLISNDFRNNKDNGVRLQVDDDAAMAAILRLNSITGNGGTLTPGVNANIPLTATALAVLCVELSSNASSNNYVLTNLQPAASFGYNNDLQNTGVIVPLGNVSLEPPGTCAALYDLIDNFP